MKRVAQRIIVSSVAIYITSLLFSGLSISGSFESYLIAGVFITFADYVLRPIITVITFPFNAITFGLFSVIVNAILLYVITLFYSKLVVVPFQFPGLYLYGFTVPSFFANQILSYIIISVTIYTIIKFIFWLFEGK